MAKVKFGAIVTDMRNKLGSTVFSRNRYGAYSRSFKSTLTSNTTAQQVVKNRLSSISASWRNLTDSQRLAWNDAVSAFKHTDVFGSIIQPAGIDLYIKLNFNLDQIGLSTLTSPPLPGVMVELTALGIVADSVAGTVTVSFSPNPIPVGFTFILLATENLSPGVNYVKNLLRTIAILPAATTSPYNATSAYTTRFTSITGGKRISIQLIAVNNATGQKSIVLNATTIVSAGSGLDYTEALDTGIPLT